MQSGRQRRRFGCLAGRPLPKRSFATMTTTTTTKTTTTFRRYVPVKSKLKHPPRAYPGHLTSFPAREGGNLINLVFPGNLIASLDFMLRVALIPRGVINHDDDKPSCIQSERYPIRGGLHKLCSVFEGIQGPFILSLACKSVVY